jgi:septum formation protein
LIPLRSPVVGNPPLFLAPEDHSASSGFLSTSQFSDTSVPPRLLLASASPRRSQLLQTIGLPFAVVLNAMPEPEPTADDHANPAQYVERLARGKAQGYVLEHALEIGPHPTQIIIAADTVVWHNGHVLNKPVDENDAVQMLSRLQGQQHQVLTGLCLRVIEQNSESKSFVEHETTTVRFREVNADWIRAYVATGEPMDKAGAYAAQGLGATIIQGIDGDFFNVVGLPLCRLTRMLERLGIAPQTWWNRS